ncbi:MAG: VirB4 family type IV secretion system protein [Clostridia bacterium]
MQNPKYFEIDNLYYSSLIVVNYYREQTDLLLKNLIETNINMNISIFYEKQDSYKTIKDLTYHIGNVGVELKEANENRQDIDIASYTYNDAKYIRKEIQVNNEELYFLYIYINLYSKDINELEYNLNKIEGISQSKGMQTRRANFRQEECFLAGLPIMENREIIKEAGKRNILTTGLLSTYPFISSTIFDKNGIFIGTNIYNNSLVFIDRYNTDKYKNANICIFGTSGAGKSFYTKLLILRYKLLGIKQYIIDPDREYNKICEKLKGVEIKLGPTSNTYINVLEIRKESIEEGESGYLAIKISKLIGFFNLIFGEMNEEEKALLEEKLIEVYNLKNINFNDKSLYNENGEFKNEKQMPILEDLFNILGQDERTKKFKIKLIPFVEGSMKFFNNYTNIKLDNELIVADIYDLGEENLKYAMYVLIDIYWDAVKKDRKEKKAIYLDEIWRLIGVTSNKYVASFIYKIFKTIRKYGGSGVAITQDISDIFSLDNGTYGKSILNNSSIKTFFALEEENIKILGEYANLSEKEKIEIKSLKRGECLMFVGEDHILTKIQASEKEKEIIEGEKINYENNYSN